MLTQQALGVVQFFEVDLPAVSAAKVELVNAVIPDKVQVRTPTPDSYTLQAPCAQAAAAAQHLQHFHQLKLTPKTRSDCSLESHVQRVVVLRMLFPCLRAAPTAGLCGG